MTNKILLISMLVYSSAFGCYGCLDYGTAKLLGEQSQVKFNTLDEQTAQQINLVMIEIQKAHEKLEVENKDLMQQTEDILSREAINEKNILFNQNVINKLKSILITKTGEENIKGMLKD